MLAMESSLPWVPPALQTGGTRKGTAVLDRERKPMFDKFRSRMEDGVITAVKETSAPLITVLYAILAALGAILFALVIRRD